MTDPETESAVLGAMLAHPDRAAPLVGELLRPEHFTGVNAELFGHMMVVFADTGRLDFIVLARVLKEVGALDRIGGGARLNELTCAAVVPAALPDACRALRDMASRRWLAGTLTKFAEQVKSGAVGEVLSGLMSEVEAIAADRLHKSHPTTRELVLAAVQRIHARAAGGEARGITTGIAKLDDATGGLFSGSQWVLAGPAKGGKSSLALGFLRSLSVQSGKRCAFFGLEMPSLENVERLLCLEGNASAAHLRDGMLGEHDMRGIMIGAQRVAPAPIHFRDNIFDLAELLGNVRRLKAAHPDLFAVFVDYAQLLNVDGTGANRERDVATISRSLRQLGLQLGLCVVLLSQVNDDGRLRESRALGMDATKIVFIEFADDPGVRTLRVIQRDGPSEKFEVAYVGDKFRFADLSNNQ